MSTQPIDSDTDKSFDEFRFEEPTAGSVFVQSLATSSLQELEEKPWEVKLPLLNHHLWSLLGSSLANFWRKKSKRRRSHATVMTIGATAGGDRIREASESEKGRSQSGCPRMADTEMEKTFSPERYFQMKDLPPMSYVMQEAILLGLSQGDYERVASSFAGGFGLSQSPISERFIERSAKALEEFETRSLKASKKRSRSIV